MPVNSIEDVWSAVCEECKKEISQIAFDTFFIYLKPHRFDDKNFIIIAKNKYIKETVESLYAKIIKNAIQNVLGMDISPYFEAEDSEETIMDAENQSKGLTFEDFFTFENFIVGSSNNFAYTASMAVANNNSIIYNPLIIYGPSGVGKTHLLLAIKNHIRKKHPHKRVVYTRGEEFTNTYITASQNAKLGMATIENFRKKYREVDVLLIDDIHFIAGKEQTQEEFFNTFNALYQKGKQIVVTLDRPLREIKTLDDRIRSRFSAGLFADITPPDFETRVGIIKNRAQQSNIPLSENMVYYIADHIKTNIRQIEGVIIKLRAYISMQNRIPTPAIVQEFTNEVIIDAKPEPIRIEKIISEVAKIYNVTEGEILSNRRTANLVLARQVSMYIARETTDLSYKAIGESFGKDHTTVLYNVNRIEEFLKDKPYEKELVDDIIKNLTGENI